jgi:hypothetical protein
LNQIRNVPLFWAIVVAMAGVRGGRMLALLAVGTVALILLDGIITAGDAWISLDVPPNGIYPLIAAVNALHNTGGMFVAPTFIGAAAALSLRAPDAAETRHARPNDPCPCGSGAKYKRCCGA